MKKGAVLVLGCGNSRKQTIIVGETDEEVAAKGPLYEDNFEDVWTIDMDPSCKPKITWDLSDLRWPVPPLHFDEIHAYEVLEHLTELGDYDSFFALWRKMYDVLKPGGYVCGSTPWWESVWVWQDPGHKRCYSSELLTYLNQAEYEKQIGTTAMTDYRLFWPKPYNFELRHARMVGSDPKTAGFNFVVQKA